MNEDKKSQSTVSDEAAKVQPVTTKVEKKGILNNDIILVNIVREHSNGMVPKDKDGYNRLEGTSVEYDAPLMSNGGVKKILTDEEQTFLENYLDSSKPKGWMGPYVETAKNVWRGPGRFRVTLTDKTLRLSMNNPIDFISYKILLANDDEVSPTYESRLDKWYLFYCQKLEEVDKNNADNIDIEFKAMEEIIKMGSDKKKMRNALLVIYKGDTTKVSREISEHTCKTMLRDYVGKQPRLFTELINSEDYKYQVMLYRGLETGALVRKGMEYRLGYSDGDLVGNSMVEAIQYLKRLNTDPTAQDKYNIFMKRVNQ